MDKAKNERSKLKMVRDVSEEPIGMCRLALELSEDDVVIAIARAYVGHWVGAAPVCNEAYLKRRLGRGTIENARVLLEKYQASAEFQYPRQAKTCAEMMVKKRG